MDTPSFPGCPAALLAYLERAFPNRCARLGMTAEQVWMEAGARMVIDHIKSQMRPSAGHAFNLDAEALLGQPTARRRR